MTSLQDKNPIVDFIGIGAQKAATTWLYYCLKEHSQICMPEEKEVHFWSEQYNQGIDYYESRFALCTEGTKRGEISTSYLSSLEAAERLQKYAPEATLVVILRNPIERAASHLHHLQERGRIPRDMPLEEALRREPLLFENGRYGFYLEHYFTLFRQDQFVVITYEEIEHDPARVVERVYRALGVDSAFAPSALNRRFNTAEQRASWQFRILNRIYLYLRGRTWGRQLLSYAKTAGIRTPSRVSRDATTAYALSAVDQALLVERYRDDIKRLERLLNRDFSHWL